MTKLRHSFVSYGLVLSVLYSTNVAAAEITVVVGEKKLRSVHDTIVELIGADANMANRDIIEIEQLDKEFSPEMSVIPRGSSVLFTNKDVFQHHVYSVSAGNQFDLPLYKGKPTKAINFKQPGIIKLGCNIHDWMLAFAYVSQSQHLIITDATGKAHFTGLPEGEYQLRIWNPRMKNNKKFMSKPIILEPGKPAELTVTLSLRNKIRKPRRNEGSNNYD